MSKSKNLKVSFIPKEGRRDRWEIHVDDEKWREVHRTIFGAKPLFPSILPDSNLQDLFDGYEFRRVKNYLLWRLSKQSCHSEQLAKQLRERLVQEKTIERVLKELQESGYLDDEAWLNGFMRGQQKRYGLPFILSKLRSKGISSETLSQLSEEGIDQEDELRSIQNLLQTRYRLKDLRDQKTRQKVYSALIRKGFSYESVRKVIGSFVNY